MTRLDERGGPGVRRIRVVNLGDVPWYTSQAVYHGIAYAMDGSTPDTITLCSPTTPYVCVGLHQEVEKEVDLEYCEQNGVPVTRREVGGGAVLLDSGQVFWHCIFHESRVPGRVEDVYGLFLTAPVSAYRAMGIPAVHRPVNDIQVEGRKIGGTGAASIGQAMVVVGSLMFDFDHALMARVLKVPSEKFRDKVYRSLQEYVTTIHRELGPAAPSRAEAVGLLLEAFGRTFGAEIYHDELTARERQAVAQQEDRLRSREWIFARGSLPKHGVKIAEGVRVLESTVKTPGGLVRSTVRVRDGRIEDITISGDFFFFPAGALAELERSLVGVAWEERVLAGHIAAFYERFPVQAPGLTASDLARAVAAAG